MIHGGLRLGDGRLLGRQLRLRRVDGDLRGVELALRQQATGGQLLGSRVLLFRVRELHAYPVQIALRLREVRARLVQIGVCLLKLRLEQRRVEPRDDLALLDNRVEVRPEPLNIAGYLTADLNGRHRLQRTGGANCVH